jgi:hypothetical protein
MQSKAEGLTPMIATSLITRSSVGFENSVTLKKANWASEMNPDQIFAVI